jgi:Co/Zn/Cd efflux system component
MLTDVAGLSLAVVASLLAQRPATSERTWGFRRAEVLAAAAQAAVLLAVGVRAGTDAVHREDQQLDQGVGDLPQPVCSNAASSVSGSG